jgi:hypothetical protein
MTSFAAYRAPTFRPGNEGFCLPLVESLVFDVPVVAYDSTAVPDTLGKPILVRKAVDRVAESTRPMTRLKPLAAGSGPPGDSRRRAGSRSRDCQDTG